MKKESVLRVGLVFDDSLDRSDGVAQYVKAVGKWLSEQGHQVSYLVGETTMKQWAGSPVYSLAKNKAVSFNANRLSVPLPTGKSALKQLLTREKYDVLHVQMPHSPFMAQRIVKLASPQTAVVGTFHIFPANILVSIGSLFLRFIYGRGLRRFDEIVSVSSAAAGFAKQIFGISSSVIPNVVELQRFRGARAAMSSHPNIVFLGRLVERKGCRLLIEAFALLHSKRPDVRLTILGDGPHRQQLEELATELGLNNCIVFKGFIDEKDKPSYLASADIACFPATGGESFGIVLIEAMAAGAGVVLGGDNPGYHSVLGAREELLVDSRDSKVFAARLEQLLEDKKMAAELHDWQQNQVLGYDICKVGPQIVNLYGRAIAKRNKKAHNLCQE